MRLQLGVVKAAVAISVVAMLLSWPHARNAAVWLAAADDPAQLSDLQIDAVLRQDPELIAHSIDAALDAGDVDLAQSHVELAAAHNLALPADTTPRIDALINKQQSAGAIAGRFATGLITGEADDLAGLSGMVAGDLFVVGDIRDLVREGKHLVIGEDADQLVLGLAGAGLAVTAASYVSFGGAVPVRAGLTLVKDARKLGRLGDGLAKWVGRSARQAIDVPALQHAAANATLARPGRTLAAVRDAFRSDKAGDLLRLAKDVGRIGDKAGTRGAFDALKVAEGPKDVARAARLAEAKGGQTRAILKILGRGALLLVTGTWSFAWWIFGAAITVVGFVSSLKALVERITQSWLDRRKARHARRLMAQQAARAATTPVAAAA